ncbi:MAG: hypothetical protein AVDCRST_MAG19-4867, partial [uncultured Thermomicrobiales bacterium]
GLSAENLGVWRRVDADGRSGPRGTERHLPGRIARGLWRAERGEGVADRAADHRQSERSPAVVGRVDGDFRFLSL